MESRDPAEEIRRAGGILTTAALRAHCSAVAIRRALQAGRIVHVARGHYALPHAREAFVVAARLGGVVSHRSAAQYWGWQVKQLPDRPDVTLPRRRRRSAEERRAANVRWADLSADAVRDRVTLPLRTVVDCMRALPFDEALCVADSALRSGRVTKDQLLAAAAASPRTGRASALAVARAADGRAANAFESSLRAICIRVEGLAVEPQVRIGGIGRVDLCDRRLRLVIEADSWEFHAGPDEFAADVRRYTAFVRIGGRVLRFGYHDVMDDPEYVEAVLRDVVALGPASGPAVATADSSALTGAA